MMNWLRRLIQGEVRRALRSDQAALYYRLDICERWIKNLDSALWRVDQAVRTGDVETDATQVHDHRQVAEQIRREVMARKARFPLPPTQRKEKVS
jgi:hypothetical protein